MFKIPLFFCILSFSIPSWADFSSFNIFGVTATDNANLEKEDKNFDMFLKLSSSNSYSSDKNEFRFRLSYNDYFKEHQNDVLNWQFGYYRQIKDSPATKVYGKILSQDYLVSESPGYTDYSFDYFGYEFGSETIFTYNQKTEFFLHPYLQQKQFTHFDGRSDTVIAINGGIDREINNKISISGDIEFGFLTSSLKEYSKNYLSIGGGINHESSSVWEQSLDLSYQTNSYTSRPVSVTTLVTARRGQVPKTESSNERTGLLVLDINATRTIKENFKLQMGWTLLNQSSVSGNETFDNNLFYAQILFKF